MTDTILPHQLPGALETYPDVRVLSLDCFDTLLWRDCHAPADVFAGLPQTTPAQRAWAESRAHQAERIGRGRHEVTVEQIYAELLPNAAPAERATAIAAELAAEAAACFGFAPTIALMHAAKARGLQVVVVSDTYLDATQLRALIAAAAGDDVAALIDRVFCSSAFGKGKAGGLYGEVLRKLSARPEEILHIGDNHGADVGGVAPFGVNTLHLLQFGETCERRLRLEAAIGAMFHRPGAGSISTPQPHRATLAETLPKCTNAAEELGAAVLGPVLHGFELWLREEARALAERGGTVHWLFLMRDGFLPLQVHSAMASEAADTAHAVEISRFTAIASGLDREDGVQAFVERELGLKPETLARQLLLPEVDIRRIVGGRSPQDASIALLREVRGGQRKRTIARASRALAQRLVAHVQGVVRPAPGDTLMLIDLGYNGSVQNEIDALLQRSLKVHVAGRYLLLRERDRPMLDKRGFIGSDDYDAHALEALCGNVAVLEQLCTTATGSVIDYTEAGAPIRRPVDVKGRQSAVRDRIQVGCLAFVRAQDRATVRRAPPADAIRLWREGATAALARMMYLPLPEELAVIESFEHDVNMGTDRTVALFDRAGAEAALRERGLFYMKGAERMYLPAELSGSGLALKLTLLSHKRFGLPLQFEDFADGAIALPVIHADRSGTIPGMVEATPTHDGYYLAAIAIGACRYSVALQFGALCEWVEVASVTAVPLDAFLSERHGAEAERIPCASVLEGMELAAKNLFRCEDEAGFMMIHPPSRSDSAQPERAMMLAVVFRPIVSRTVIGKGLSSELLDIGHRHLGLVDDDQDGRADIPGYLQFNMNPAGS